MQAYKELNRNNITSAIRHYYELLKELEPGVNPRSSSIPALALKHKRDPLGCGPYPHTSWFETANRVMTDLTLLRGIELIFEGAVEDLDFQSYRVEYGIGNRQGYDIVSGDRNNPDLRGEVFNVSNSLFRLKMKRTLEKLRKKKDEHTKILIIHNDLETGSFKNLPQANEYALSVPTNKILDFPM